VPRTLAVAVALVLGSCGAKGDVRIRITLDRNGQTRVDLRSASRKGKGDFGVNARRIGRFLRALDRRLGATPEQILDPTRPIPGHG